VVEKARAAKQAALMMATLTTEEKNGALEAIARAIEANSERIVAANQADLAKAEQLLAEGRLTKAFVKRLRMDSGKVKEVVRMVRSVAALEDPVGRTLYAIEMDEGLEVYRVSTPIGVVGAVFESRPDVLPQISSLCLKAGDAVILKGGSEAKETNEVLYQVIREASEAAGLPKGWIQLIEAREEVAALLGLEEYVDLLVPRGSKEFVKYVMENTNIPVLGHADGICQVYVDRAADLDKALAICYDAKVQYPAVCNAVDTILVHEAVAQEFIPRLVARLREAGVEIWGCPRTRELVDEGVKPAGDREWGTEWLDLKVGIRVVDSLEAAIDHIHTYGSRHTDTIVTEDPATALRFLREVDSSTVLWNASTRFSDGYRYGLGAEVGISTGKLHARGPTGLEGLTIYKYVVIGRGHVVKDYVGSDARPFTHRPLKKSWREVAEAFG
jgi:glutamate-5-semialdehyde dehydrogenase